LFTLQVQSVKQRVLSRPWLFSRRQGFSYARTMSKPFTKSYPRDPIRTCILA